MAGIGVLEDAEDLPERAEFETEGAADIDGAVIVGLGEAVGLGLELRMLAAGDQLERIELGGEMAAGAIGADQHAGAEGVARRSQRLLLAQRALGQSRQQRRGPVRRRPRRSARLGQHVGLVVVETGEEGAPRGIERGGVLLVLGVELGEIGGVGALQERRVEKHLVQFVSRHRINPAGRCGATGLPGKQGELWALASAFHLIVVQGSFQGQLANLPPQFRHRALPQFCASRRLCRLR